MLQISCILQLHTQWRSVSLSSFGVHIPVLIYNGTIFFFKWWKRMTCKNLTLPSALNPWTCSTYQLNFLSSELMLKQCRSRYRKWRTRFFELHLWVDAFSQLPNAACYCSTYWSWIILTTLLKLFCWMRNKFWLTTNWLVTVTNSIWTGLLMKLVFGCSTAQLITDLHRLIFWLSTSVKSIRGTKVACIEMLYLGPFY